MCGLAGIFGGGPDVRPRVVAALGCMTHRGPDAEAVADLPSCSFGYRRLAIRLAGPGGGAYNHQPFRHAARRLTMFAVGEVYDAPTAPSGVAPAGDLAVLLERWAAYGVPGLQDLDAEFAVAIWDARARSGVLARDRLGVKPLFYAEHEGTLCFASEIKGLRALGVPLTPCPLGVLEYLRFGYVMAPRTIYTGVSAVPAGGAITWRDGVVEATSGAPLGALAEDAAVDAWEAVRTAATARLAADVPVGFHLSGGVDSSLIAHAAAREGQDAFTLVYDEAPEDVDGDAGWSVRVASALGLHHHLARIPSDAALDAVDACITIMDGPMMSPGALTPCLLAREAAGDAKVMLEGQGSDEVFLGYARHRVAEGTPREHLSAVAANVDAAALERVVRRPDAVGSADSGFAQWVREAAGTSSLEAFQEAYLRTFLHELLRVEDHAHMAVSVENRVPFLHRAVVAAGLRSARAEGARALGKPVLWEALAAVGSPAAERNGKQQMRLTDDLLRAWVEQTLRRPGALERIGPVRAEAADVVLGAYDASPTMARLAWALANLSRWLEREDLVVEQAA